MKNILLVFVCFTILLSCKEKPTYNPFDNQFNIDESYFIKDKLDTIWDTCGYYAIVKRENHSEIAYGYHESNFTGKFFGFYIDTITTKHNKYDERITDSINSLTFNPKKLNNSLSKFNYKFFKQINNQVLIINKEQKIDTGKIYSSHLKHAIFYRSVSFINKNKNWKGWN